MKTSLDRDLFLETKFGTISTCTLSRGSTLPAAEFECAVTVLNGSAQAEGVGLNHGDGVYGPSEVVVTSDRATLLVLRTHAAAGNPKTWRYAPAENRTDGVLCGTGGFTDMGVRWLATTDTVGSKDLVVATSTFLPDGSHGAHRHPHADEFFLVTKGGGEHLTPDGPIPMTAGDLVLVPAGEWHGFRATTGVTTAVYGYLGAGSLHQAGYELED